MKRALGNTAGVFLDFDGVLFDSALEACVIGGMTWKGVSAKQAAHHSQEFCQFRYLISDPKDVLSLLKTLEEANGAEAAVVENVFARISAALSDEDASDFRNAFFSCRANMRNTDPAQWLELQRPYTFLDDIKSLMTDQPECFFIVSTKDGETIKHLMAGEGIRLSDDAIFGSEAFQEFGSKRAIIEALMDRHSFTATLFIDDHRPHLNDCKNVAGIKLLLAGWGYVVPGDSVATMGEALEAIMDIVTDC